MKISHFLTRLYNPKDFYSQISQENQAKFQSGVTRLDTLGSCADGSEKVTMTSFILAGHCMGGYIAGNYAVKYSKHLSKLILLSPVGVAPSACVSKSEAASKLSLVLNQKDLKDIH